MKVDVRVVAATNRDLEAEYRNGTFRNGDRVAEPVLLHTGDIVRLGDGGPEVEIVMERDVILESDSPIRS